MMADTPSIPKGTKGKRPRKPLDAEHRQARAALILAAKLGNKRTQDIMAEFNLSRASVYRALSDARKMGLLTQARDWLTLNVVPLSLAAIEEALTMGDIPTKVETAFRVLDGLGITGKHATLTVEQGKGIETFESFRETVVKRVTRPLPTGPEAGAAATDDAVLEGNILTSAEAGPTALVAPDSGNPPSGPLCDDPSDLTPDATTDRDKEADE